MRVYQLKSRAQRATAFALAVGMFGIVSAYALPNGKVSADPLNPLTERTLLLSSSAPGDHYLDAAGNETYAAPGSGPNGKKTGETFSFKVSTNSTNSGFGATNKPIKAFTFQYCTSAAGDCYGPGANGVNLNAHYGSAMTETAPEISGTDPVQNVDFEIWVGGVKVPGTDWEMTVSNQENGTNATHTNAKNFITLAKTGSATSGSVIQPASGTAVRIVFKASSSNYITNPQSGAFFVRINDYDSELTANHVPNVAAQSHIIDGGVTVANVMTDSIEIRTKVLETMSFSVGTENPDTKVLTTGSHGPCDAITVNTPLYLGTTAEEFSLNVSQAYDTHSYWRLSSNSSNGASVYYSGYTLSNTVGDQIDAMNLTSGQWANSTTVGIQSHPGMEQFGLGFDTQDTPVDQRDLTDPQNPLPGFGVANTNELDPLIPRTVYAAANGTIVNSGTARFAFDPASDQIPSLLATENSDVVGCTTGKMRYVANIAAVTPAGIYSSKVNYLASPQY